MSELGPRSSLDFAGSGRPAGSSVAGGANGRWLVLGLVLVAVGLALFAVWFQWGQTRRCLRFYGAAAAGGIQKAPRVELWSLSDSGGKLRAATRLDISRAPGLVHLRRGLIEDVNFAWVGGEDRGGGPLPVGDWDAAIAFYPADPSASATAVVAFDLDEPGFATVVGRPGRIQLGRIGGGLRAWIDETKGRFSGQKSGF